MDYTTLLTILLATVVISVFFAFNWLNKKRQRKHGKVDIESGGREMGDWERILADTTALGVGINSYVIFLESKIQLTEELLIKAAFMIRARHPLLRMRIMDTIDSNGFVRKIFEPVEKQVVDVKTIVGDNWIEAHSKEMATNFDVQNDPLWRLRILTHPSGETRIAGVYKSTFIVTFHHSIIDGNTIMRFVDELLDYLNSVVEGNEKVPESLPLQPCLEKAIGITSMPWWQILVVLIVMAKETLFKRPNPYIKRYGLEMTRNPDAVSGTKVIPIEFSIEETQLIKTYSSEHKATVNGTLLGAALVASAFIVDEEESGKPMKMKTLFPANLRGACIPPLDARESFGTYAPPYFMDVNVPTKIDPDSFGKFASDLTKKTHEQIRKGEGQQFLQLAEVIYDLNLGMEWFIRAFTDPKQAHRGEDVVMISNLGNLHYFTTDKPRAFEITGRHNGCSSEKLGSVFDSYAATINGKLFWTVCYATNITSEAQAQEYGDAVVGVLKKVCMSK